MPRQKIFIGVKNSNAWAFIKLMSKVNHKKIFVLNYHAFFGKKSEKRIPGMPTVREYSLPSQPKRREEKKTYEYI